MIERQIIRQYPYRFKAIPDLKADDRVALLALEHKL